MIQHLSQSASKGRNLKTKERIQSAKITQQRKQFSLSFKVKAVEDFQTEKQNFPKVKMATFLKNLDCGDGETLNECTFRRWITNHESNKSIINQDRIRNRKSNLPDVEEKIVNYLNFRKERFSKDKCGISYDLIRSKALEFSDIFLASEKQIHQDLENSLRNLQDNEDIEKAVKDKEADNMRDQIFKSQNRIEGKIY